MDKQTINQNKLPKCFSLKMTARLMPYLASSLGLAGLLAPAHSFAARWVLPPAFEGQLTVTNSGKNPAGFYMKDFGLVSAHPAGEMLYWIKAGETLRLTFKNASHIVFDSDAKALSFITQASSGDTRTLSAGQSNTLYFPSRSLQSGEVEELIVQNLSSQSQDGRILSWKSGQSSPEVQSFALQGREELRIGLAGLSGSAFHIQGTFNLTARLAAKDIHPDLIPNTQDPKAPVPKVSFVLANSDRSQSFVFETSDVKLIAEARAQIQNPTDYRARILIAEVEKNTDGRNLDFFSTTKNPWSWQIKKAFNFAELASQSCDNNPQNLEDNLHAFLKGDTPSGRPVICMWAYQIVRELP